MLGNIGVQEVREERWCGRETLVRTEATGKSVCLQVEAFDCICLLLFAVLTYMVALGRRLGYALSFG